jgi:hypothetical protein
MEEDVTGGRASPGAGNGQRENFRRSARAPPATRRRAGHITGNHGTQVTASTHDFAVSLG